MPFKNAYERKHFHVGDCRNSTGIKHHLNGEKMPLLTPQQYVEYRQNYRYDACLCKFSIEQTGSLQNIGEFSGIFTRQILPSYPKGINIRRFEIICQEVFQDCHSALNIKQ